MEKRLGTEEFRKGCILVQGGIGNLAVDGTGGGPVLVGEGGFQILLSFGLSPRNDRTTVSMGRT